MNAFQVLDALSASFFGLLGIWAAVVRRHWFLRFAAVTAVLLTTLLIPAFEVALEFALQIGIIALAVWIAGRRSHWQPRFSLETALLLTVVVSVVAAVLAQAPRLGWRGWTEIIGVGVVTACAALLGLWIVCGSRHLTVRALVGALGTIVLVVMLYVAEALMHAARQAAYGNPWRAALAEFFSLDYLPTWLAWTLPTVVLGMVIMLSLLALGRASQWFTSEASTQQPQLKTVLAARAGLCVMALAISLPLGYILIELAFPAPLPMIRLPSPNGYDDLVVAGRMVPDNTTNRALLATSTSNAQLGAEVQALAPVYDRIALGLSRRCRADLAIWASDIQRAIQERSALRAAERALLIRLAYVRRTGTAAQRIENALAQLCFAEEASRGKGALNTTYNFDSRSRDWAASDLYLMLSQSDAEQCRDVARRLFEHDKLREPWSEHVRVQRIIDANAGWMSRYLSLVCEWSGNLYESQRQTFLRLLAEERALVVMYALRAYGLEHKKLPDNLQSLVPELLPAIPADAYGPGLMKLRPQARGVCLFSVGVDGDDDRGEPYPVDSNGQIDSSQGDCVWLLTPAQLGLEAAENSK